MLSLSPQPSISTDVSAEASGREAVRHALAYCRQRMRFQQDPTQRLCEGDPQAHEWFRHGLACWLAVHVAPVDDTLLAVYLADVETLDEQLTPTTPLTLVCRVTRRTAALESLFSHLDAAITRRYQEVLGHGTSAMTSLLDVHLVDDSEFKRGGGHAGLLSAVHHRMTRVWKRA